MNNMKRLCRKVKNLENNQIDSEMKVELIIAILNDLN
jgi:hypothetical protein